MKIDPRKIVVLDFETFYSTEFSLSKPAYNTSSYVRDPQFKEHCVAIKIGKNKTKGYKNDAVGKALRAIDWTTHAVCAHNTAFDGFVLSQRFGIVPHYYIDTVSMTRGLHNEVSRASLAVIAEFYQLGAKSKTYLTPTKGLRELPPDIMKGLIEGCILDVDLCYEIMLKQLAAFPPDELDLIDMTMRMFCDPVLQVDEELARQALSDEMVARRSEILKARHIIKGIEVEEANLMSNQKFAELLRKCDVEPPTKISGKTGMENFAFAQTDPEFTDLLDYEDKRVVLLTKARLAAKSTQAETRAFRLLQAGENGAKLPVGYNYFGAKTGRWSGTNKLNMQNLPRVNPKEPKPSDGLRRSIIAPPGHSLVVTDSAQIEARITAWLCGQDDVMQIFRLSDTDPKKGERGYETRHGDPYEHMAMAIYRTSLEKINKDQRFIGKIATLGLGFSMGHKKFQTTLALGMMGPAVYIPLSEAQRIVKLYRARNSKIAATWTLLDDTLIRMASGGSGTLFDGLLEYDPMTVWLPNGMGLHYPGLHVGEKGDLKYSSNRIWKKIYGGLLLENIVQALARVVVGEQMLRTKEMIDKLKLKKGEVARVVLMTHDEIVSCVPDRYAQKVYLDQLHVMRQPPHNWGCTIPLNADGGYAKNYSK